MHDCRQELETTNKNTPAHAAALQFRVNGAEPRYSAPIFFGRIWRAAVGCDWVGRGGTCSSLTDWMWLSCSSGATESDVCLTLAASSQNVKFPVCQKKKPKLSASIGGRIPKTVSTDSIPLEPTSNHAAHHHGSAQHDTMCMQQHGARGHYA